MNLTVKIAIPLLNGTFRNARARSAKWGEKSWKNDKHSPLCISYTAVSEAKRKKKKKKEQKKKEEKDATYLSEEHHRDAIRDWTRNEEPF